MPPATEKPTEPVPYPLTTPLSPKNPDYVKFHELFEKKGWDKKNRESFPKGDLSCEEIMI